MQRSIAFNEIKWGQTPLNFDVDMVCVKWGHISNVGYVALRGGRPRRAGRTRRPTRSASEAAKAGDPSAQPLAAASAIRFVVIEAPGRAAVRVAPDALVAEVIDAHCR